MSDFFVLKSQYDLSLQHTWQLDDKVRSLIEGEWYTGTIKEIKTPSSASDVWQQYAVEWSGTDETAYLSPWDIEPESETTESIYNTCWTRLESSVIDRVLPGLRTIAQSSVAALFLEQIDFEKYKDYCMKVRERCVIVSVGRSLSPCTST